MHQRSHAFTITISQIHTFPQSRPRIGGAAVVIVGRCYLPLPTRSRELQLQGKKSSLTRKPILVPTLLPPGKRDIKSYCSWVQEFSSILVDTEKPVTRRQRDSRSHAGLMQDHTRIPRHNISTLQVYVDRHQLWDTLALG